jgi:hypothetical protein
MTISMYEAPDSRPVSLSSRDGTQITRWHVKTDNPEGEDEVDATFYVLANTPTVLNGLIRNSCRLDPVEGRTDRWTAEVEYRATGQDGTADALGSTPSDPSLSAPSQAGTHGETPSESALGAGYSFEIGTQTTHVTHSRRQMGRVASGADVASGTITLTGTANVVTPAYVVEPDGEHVGKVIWIASPPAGWYVGGYKILAVSGVDWVLDRAPARDTATGAASWFMKPEADDHGGAIGVTPDEIKGVDVFTPTVSFTRTVSRAAMSMAYFKALAAMVGRKNDRPWYGHAPGEVLYMGCSGQFSQKDRYSLAHRFSVSFSETDIAIVPGELTVPYKRGWDWLWVSYEERDNEEKTRKLIRPQGAYVEEVYPDGDFELLGLGR